MHVLSFINLPSLTLPKQRLTLYNAGAEFDVCKTLGLVMIFLCKNRRPVSAFFSVLLTEYIYRLINVKARPVNYRLGLRIDVKICATNLE